MVLAPILTPENAHQIIAKADRGVNALYLALHPFRLETRWEFVGGTNRLETRFNFAIGIYQEFPQKADFASPDIERIVLETEGPMLIFQGSSSIYYARQNLSGKSYAGSRYFVPTLDDSLNLCQGIGALHQYIDYFSPETVKIFGLNQPATKVKNWLKDYLRLGGSISTKSTGD